jgi:serine/threonine-protein kinase
MSDARQRLTAALADRYRVERELGAGGMATVYLAHDLRHHREVAIKVLHEDLGAALGTERFLREIQAVARLTHPHILPLFDSGQAGGVLFYVMPHIRGRTLRHRLDAMPRLPVPEAVAIAAGVAEALDHAHGQGIVHRDIKPENILLQDGHPLVADFGISRVLDGGASATLTRAGMSMGTPAYMSPEQALGDGVDGRSDLYSLGCVLHEMLTGEPPFTGDSAQAVIAKRILHDPADVGVLREGIPAPVARALRRALSRDPADRFASGRAFADALRAPDEGLAALEERSLAVLPFANLSPDPDTEYFADGITEEILGTLARLGDLRVAGRSASFALKGKGFDARQAATQLRVRTVLEGSVRRAGNRLRITAQLTDASQGFLLWSERYDRDAADVFAVQEEIAQAIASRMDLRRGPAARAASQRATTSIEAYDAYLKGRQALGRRGGAIPEAIQDFERAIALDPNYGPAWSALAYALLVQGYWGMAAPGEVAPRVRDACRRALRLSAGDADSHAVAAMASLAFDWDVEAAEAGFARAMALDPHHHQCAVWYWVFLRGMVCGEFDAVEAALEEVYARDPESLVAAGSGAILLGGIAGRGAQALTWARRAMTLDPRAFLSTYALMVAHWSLDDFASALAISPAVLMSSGRGSSALMHLALVRAGAGNREGAAALLKELQSRARDEYVPRLNMAVIAAAIGESERALRLLEESVQSREPAVLWCLHLRTGLWALPGATAMVSQPGVIRWGGREAPLAHRGAR